MFASIGEICFCRFYTLLVLFFYFYLPTMIPVWCWDEIVWKSFFIAVMARYGVSMNSTFLVNSAAHKYGDQPFDKYIEARENPFVALLMTGEC
ncbi:hypothetical protein AVEN_101040-1 [Araneus ventricosus]|uniref:Uncharacterized protein n=1 Tax=Araneus ventricosus TaxID=182803 RepID=A0A4Y2KAR1_ARAVE|nr:hypothetical protein AVEN_101040-1 [Araneus ventricosus]